MSPRPHHDPGWQRDDADVGRQDEFLCRAPTRLLIVAIPLAVAAYLVRGFVQHNAPFYGSSHILIVGVGVGVLTMCAVAGLWRAAGLPLSQVWMGAALGLIAIAAISGRRSRLDWANKSRQVAIVAAVTYAFITGALFLFVR